MKLCSSAGNAYRGETTHSSQSKAWQANTVALHSLVSRRCIRSTRLEACARLPAQSFILIPLFWFSGFLHANLLKYLNFYFQFFFSTLSRVQSKIYKNYKILVCFCSELWQRKTKSDFSHVISGGESWKLFKTKIHVIKSKSYLNNLAKSTVFRAKDT